MMRTSDLLLYRISLCTSTPVGLERLICRADPSAHSTLTWGLLRNPHLTMRQWTDVARRAPVQILRQVVNHRELVRPEQVTWLLENRTEPEVYESLIRGGALNDDQLHSDAVIAQGNESEDVADALLANLDPDKLAQRPARNLHPTLRALRACSARVPEAEAIDALLGANPSRGVFENVLDARPNLYVRLAIREQDTRDPYNLDYAILESPQFGGLTAEQQERFLFSDGELNALATYLAHPGTHREVAQRVVEALGEHGFSETGTTWQAIANGGIASPGNPATCSSSDIKVLLECFTQLYACRSLLGNPNLESAQLEAIADRVVRADANKHLREDLLNLIERHPQVDASVQRVLDATRPQEPAPELPRVPLEQVNATLIKDRTRVDYGSLDDATAAALGDNAAAWDRFCDLVETAEADTLDQLTLGELFAVVASLVD